MLCLFYNHQECSIIDYALAREINAVKCRYEW